MEATQHPASPVAIYRFLNVLEKSPRRGTAFDRVYGYHVENGSLDKFLAAYEERVRQNARDASAWMMLGLVHAQRGKNAAAADAFLHADEDDAARPLASYYLGLALVQIGRQTDAIAALERALDRNPNPGDLPEISRALARLNRRDGRVKESLAVWDRLEKLLPDDLRVQEQIASALAEDGETEAALLRYQELAGRIVDPYRRAAVTIEAAGLKIRLGRSEMALHDLEQMQGTLDRDHWLYREADVSGVSRNFLVRHALRIGNSLTYHQTGSPHDCCETQISGRYNV